jgi:hypothetical protein
LTSEISRLTGIFGLGLVGSSPLMSMTSLWDPGSCVTVTCDSDDLAGDDDDDLSTTGSETINDEVESEKKMQKILYCQYMSDCKCFFAIFLPGIFRPRISHTNCWE